MGQTAQEILNAKIYIGFSKFWLPNRVGPGTGTKRAVVDRSNYFPIVAWGTSTAVITNCVISAVLIHKKEFREFKTTTNKKNFIFPPINKCIHFPTIISKCHCPLVSILREEEPFMQK